MTYDLIIFDCDGTLVDTEYLNIKAVISLLRDLGIEDYDIEHGLTHFSGHRFSHIIGMIAQETGFTFPDNAAKLYLGKVNALSETETKDIEHVYDMVETAKKYADICVVSNGERNNVLSSLERANLLHFFEEEFVFTGLMAPNPKPAPDLFLLAANQKDICPSKTLVIEDSIAGVMGATAANMDVWGFCGTHHAPQPHAETLIKTGAKATYTSMQGVITALEKIQSA